MLARLPKGHSEKFLLTMSNCKYFFLYINVFICSELEMVTVSPTIPIARRGFVSESLMVLRFQAVREVFVIVYVAGVKYLELLTGRIALKFMPITKGSHDHVPTIITSSDIPMHFECLAT